jgi:methionine-rich copper-binding protein CopC
MTFRAVARLIITALLVLAPGGSVASAHGVIESSNPAADSFVRRVPQNVEITLSEAPGPGTTVRLSDGCDRNVVDRVRREGEILEIGVGKAEPGRWRVRLRVVSAVDGHTTRGTFAFKVRGKPGCRHTLPSVLPDDQVAGGEDTQIANDLQEDESDFPIVPFAIGSIVIVAIALLLRRFSG